MCFGKSSDSSSRKMAQMQQEEAAAARQKEADRQSRITSGIERIRQAFEGTPQYASRATNKTLSGPGTGTVSGAAVPGMSGYTYKQINTPAAAAAVSRPTYNTGGGHDFGPTTGGTGSHSSSSPQSVGSNRFAGNAAGAGGGSKWVVVGPDGREHQIGENVGGSEQYFTGRTSGGIDENFYNDYKGGVVDYYMPQVQEKYKDASDELTYRLARAGLLRSSMANTETADLSKQNTLNEAKVRNDADKATADLRGRVASEKAKAESQLYATENPDVAANQATAAIQNITAETPDLNPLGDIFSVAAIGGANALKAYQTQGYKKQVPGYQSSSRIV